MLRKNFGSNIEMKKEASFIDKHQFNYNVIEALKSKRSRGSSMNDL